MHWYLLASSPGWERNDHECYYVLFKTCKYGRRWMNVERYSRLPCLDCAQTSLTSHIPNLDVKKDQNVIHWSRPCDQSFLSTLTTPSVQPVRRRDPGWSRQQRRNWRCSRKTITLVETEVNISPNISISAQPLKMALHRNPAVHGSRMVIFLHDSKKAPF